MSDFPTISRGLRRTRAMGRAPRTDRSDASGRGGSSSVMGSEVHHLPPAAHTAIPRSPVDDSNDFSDDPGLTQFTAQEYPDEDVDDDLEGEDMEDEADHEDFGHPDDDQDLLDEIMDEDLMDHMHDQDEQIESDDDLQEAPFDPAAIGLKEINNLAHFGVSSHKPGNGVEELLSDDVSKFWQSDGQQPHLLTIHFLRRVEIRAIRFYVDYSQDESYTPTHIIFYAGTGHHDLIQFAEVPLTNPIGWQDVPLDNCGGGPDGNTLCCWIVQMHVKENHQNGKDTHIRGIKIYGVDESASLGGGAGGLYAAGPGGFGGGDAVLHEMGESIDRVDQRNQRTRTLAMRHSIGDDDSGFQELLDSLDQASGGRGRRKETTRYRPGEGGFSSFPDFMREPEIR